MSFLLPARALRHRYWVVERDGVEVACGGEYVPGERLNARIDDASNIRYVMELTAGGTFDQSDGGCFGDNVCGESRCAKGDPTRGSDGTGQALIAPTDGSDLVVHGGWAPSFGAVSIPDDCVLTALVEEPCVSSFLFFSTGSVA